MQVAYYMNVAVDYANPLQPRRLKMLFCAITLGFNLFFAVSRGRASHPFRNPGLIAGTRFGAEGSYESVS